jgi:hypothetical protein
MKAVVFNSTARPFTMDPYPRPRLNAAAPFGVKHAQYCQPTGSNLTTRVGTARFRRIRALFNKRTAQDCPKADYRSNIRNAPLPDSNIDEVCCTCLETTASPNGELSMKTPSLWMIAAVSFMASASAAHARSAYDGSWDLAFVTQTGSCDPSYNFTVNITDGIVTHPNLVRFRGYVAKSGSVRASVTVQDKFAAGTGRLFGTSGRGKWSGREGSGRCSGYWTAQRN